MEGLFLILLVIFIIVNSKNKAKKAAGKDAARVDRGSRATIDRPGNATSSGAGAASTGAGRRVMKDLTEALQGGETTVAQMIEEARGAQPAPKPAKALSQQERAERRKALEAKRAARLAAAAAESVDSEGCVGGSMAHEHTEGESREEHARHMEEVRQREAEAARVEEDAHDLAAMNLRRLREAVVMAEVLGKPKALRPRGQVRN